MKNLSFLLLPIPYWNQAEIHSISKKNQSTSRTDVARNVSTFYLHATSPQAKNDLYYHQKKPSEINQKAFYLIHSLIYEPQERQSSGLSNEQAISASCVSFNFSVSTVNLMASLAAFVLK